MSLPVVFETEIAEQIIKRIEKLTPETKPHWGKMDAAQMLAHCNVTYELAYENIHPKPNSLMRWMLKTLVKKSVVNEKPYPHNSKTAPVFIIKSTKDFEKEKERLIGYIRKTSELGASYFEQRESVSFGALSATEWNNMFYKHLNHHLTQFGV
jgi:hypothetical protein